MSSREVILQRIRSGLTKAVAAGFGDLREPPTPEVWPRTNVTPADLVTKFCDELRLLNGEPIHCTSVGDARRQLCQLMQSGEWPRLGCLDRPLTRELTIEIEPGEVDWVLPDWSSERIEQVPAALITADALLADTGSCVVRCSTAPERLMCYLPPTCVIAARVDQLVEHLPAAWEPIAATCRAADSRGETVIISGPSRTADIEKKLILGVHGPKRLIVLLID